MTEVHDTQEVDGGEGSTTWPWSQRHGRDGPLLPWGVSAPDWWPYRERGVPALLLRSRSGEHRGLLRVPEPSRSTSFAKPAGVPDPRAAQFDHVSFNLPDEKALLDCGPAQGGRSAR